MLVRASLERRTLNVISLPDLCVDGFHAAWPNGRERPPLTHAGKVRTKSAHQRLYFDPPRSSQDARPNVVMGPTMLVVSMRTRRRWTDDAYRIHAQANERVVTCRRGADQRRGRQRTIVDVHARGEQ